MVNPVTETTGVKKYLMAIIMVVVAIVQAVIAYATDGFAQDEIVQIAVIAAGAIAVWWVPNFPRWPWLKTGVGAIIIGLNLALQLIEGGITTEEWYMIGVAVLGAVGLIAAPKPITQRAE